MNSNSIINYSITSRFEERDNCVIDNVRSKSLTIVSRTLASEFRGAATEFALKVGLIVPVRSAVNCCTTNTYEGKTTITSS